MTLSPLLPHCRAPGRTALSLSQGGPGLPQPPPGASPEPQHDGSTENSEVPFPKLTLSQKENLGGCQPARSESAGSTVE